MGTKKLLLGADGGLYVTDSSDKEKKRRTKLKTLFRGLNWEIEIEDGANFGSFLKCIESFKNEAQVIFLSHLGGHPIEPFIEEGKLKPPKENYHERDGGISHLEVYWGTDIYQDEEEQTFTSYVDFHGINKETDKLGVTSSAIELTPMNELKGLKLTLNKEFRLQEFKKTAKGYKPKLLFKGTKEFTLYDVFGGILNEISFHGEPSSRDKFRGELLSTIDNIKLGKIKPVKKSIEDLLS